MKKERIIWMTAIIVLMFAGALWGTVTEKFEVMWDRKGPIDAISTCSHVDARVLAADSAETITVPSGAEIVMFGCVDGSGNAASFYADFTTTAAEPAADITNGSGAELNPYIRYIGSATSISVLAPSAAILTAQFYFDSF